MLVTSYKLAPAGATVRTAKSPGGKPGGWNRNASAAENFRNWKDIGRMGHKAVESLSEFAQKYKYTNKQFGNSGRPDGWSIDYVNKVVRIAETKGFTRAGLKNGIQQLSRYAAEAKRLYPDFSVEQELWLYRAYVPLQTISVEYVVKQGDNLWNIAQNYGTSLDNLYKLNPSVDKSNNIIYPNQVLKLDSINLEEVEEPKNYVEKL